MTTTRILREGEKELALKALAGIVMSILALFACVAARVPEDTGCAPGRCEYSKAS